MFKNALRLFLPVLLVFSATLIVVPPSADGDDNCDPVLEPFVARDANFNPFFTRDTVSAGDLLDFSGSIPAAIEDASSVLARTGVPPTVRTFFQDSLAFFVFLDSRRCAAAVAYPDPIELVPTTPGAPYGFSHNPVAASSYASVPANQPVSVSATAAPAGSTAAAATDLAHTGGETGLLMYFGAGLVGFGALALGSRRRYL